MTTGQPLFTIATITYNSGKWVRQAIESVLASGYADFEYIISDDHSSDDSWEIIQQYHDPRIRAWRNETNIGEYPSRNKVLTEAKGRYIIYIDGDDILYKTTLRNLAEYIDAFPESGMIWGVLTPLNNYAVFPYLFEPVQTMQLLYDYSNYIGVIGFTETLFSVGELKKAGGFSNKYAIGDIYIRKRLALTCKVLFVPLGFGYWRSTPGQASSKLGSNYRGTMEGMEIDLLLLKNPLNPLPLNIRQELENYLKSTFIRRLIKQVLLKGKPQRFIEILRLVGFRFNDWKLMFQHFHPFQSIVNDISDPIHNDYNFKK